ncbi:hypothetical protein B5V91_19620, partial [Heyndrickxia sporothermodurans]
MFNDLEIISRPFFCATGNRTGQKAAMKKLVDNYDLNTEPAINVPKVGHTIKGPHGIVSRSTKGIDNPRQLLARDIRELRRV